MLEPNGHAHRVLAPDALGHAEVVQRAPVLVFKGLSGDAPVWPHLFAQSSMHQDNESTKCSGQTDTPGACMHVSHTNLSTNASIPHGNGRSDVAAARERNPNARHPRQERRQSTVAARQIMPRAMDPHAVPGPVAPCLHRLQAKGTTLSSPRTHTHTHTHTPRLRCNRTRTLQNGTVARAHVEGVLTRPHRAAAPPPSWAGPPARPQRTEPPSGETYAALPTSSKNNQ